MIDKINIGEIRFKPKEFEDEELFVHRVAHAIGKFDEMCPPFAKDSGYKWQLNSSNNWWTSPSDQCLEPGVWIIAYRYWGSDDAQKMLQELQDKVRELFE